MNRHTFFGNTYGFLFHHGVKGQKWGIRRWQNEDGTLTPEGKEHYRTHDYEFEKGFRFNTTVASKYGTFFDNQPKVNYVYDAGNETDSHIYKGILTYAKVLNGSQYIATKEYEAVNDLKAPSDTKAVDLFVEAYKDNPSEMAKGLTTMRKYVDFNKKMLSKRGIDLSKAMNDVLDGPKKYNKRTSEEELRNIGFKLMVNNSGMLGDPKVAKAVDAFYNKIKSKGYNALIDYNNRGVYNDAQMPLIILDSLKDLKVKNIVSLNVDDYEDSLNKAVDHVTKLGETVRL